MINARRVNLFSFLFSNHLCHPSTLGTGTAIENFTMKNLLKILALLTTSAIPGALALELAGVNLPAGFDAGRVFGAFVVSFIALIVLSDYAPAHSFRVVASRAATKAVHPLVA
jgi:hypothetical protein